LKRTLLALLLLSAAPAAAQHAFSRAAQTYDPAVPTPRSVLGYEVGERFTPHHLLMRYLERLAATSPRVKLDTVAHSFEGREVMRVVLTSPANHRRLAEIRADARRLADPRGAGTAELAAVVRRTPAITWLGYTVHGNEASGTEASLAVLYQLAAGRDAETQLVLDSTVVLIDPVQNPDGHERHVQDVMRMRGAFGVPVSPGARIHQGDWPGARTSHYYFDLNRDWFIHSHPETRGRAETFLTWAPHVAVDLHEMGSGSTYFFAPPMEPINKNVDPGIVEWWEIYAAANAAALTERGESFFRREGYDEFYPGYGVSWPVLNGAVGMTYEQASSRGGAIRREDGTVLTLRDAAANHYATSWATALTTARRRFERVRDYLAFRQRAATLRAPVRSVVFERDAQGRADSLAARLLGNGIEVRRLRAAASVGGAREYGAERAGTARLPAGSYVVDLAQPQGRLARALLEPDAVLDSTFIHQELESRRTGQADRFYDVTAWSLPYTFRVRAWTAPGVPGPTDTVEGLAGPGAPAAPAAPAEARYAYAWEAGSEAGTRLLAALLADSVRVWYAARGFRAAGADFPQGAYVARVAPNGARVHPAVRRHAAATGARVVGVQSALVEAGTDLGSNSVFPLRAPRVALLGGEGISGNSFGFAWFALDQRIRYPSTPVDVSALSESTLNDFDVLVIPSASPAALERALGEAGKSRLAAWVRRGGVLVTLENATAWLAQEKTGISRLRPLPAAEPDSAGAPGVSQVPGAIVRAAADTLSPLLAGVRQAELPVLAFSDLAFRAPRNVRPGEVVLRHAPLPRLRLAGYLWPEAPARLAGSPYLWTERVGEGRVVAFTGDPNFRDLWRGLQPLFANALFFGPSF
jgi:hypothetical protein